MRLGHHFSWENERDLPALYRKLDTYGLSAIAAPAYYTERSDEELQSLGQLVRAHGLRIGESPMWANLMTDDKDEQRNRIERVRLMLKKADQLGCHCVVTLVGSKHPSDRSLAPSKHMVTAAGRREFKEVVLRILDGLDLKTTKYAIEPWHNTFFYQPEDVREFLDEIGHDSLAVHLDPMNMINQATYHDTSSLIERIFRLLSDRIACVHFKDLCCDYGHMFLKWDEVLIGDGVLDYPLLLSHLNRLDPDLIGYCEHLKEEGSYALNFARLHQLARESGVPFVKRNP